MYIQLYIVLSKLHMDPHILSPSECLQGFSSVTQCTVVNSLFHLLLDTAAWLLVSLACYIVGQDSLIPQSRPAPAGLNLQS